MMSTNQYQPPCWMVLITTMLPTSEMCQCGSSFTLHCTACQCPNVLTDCETVGIATRRTRNVCCIITVRFRGMCIGWLKSSWSMGIQHNHVLMVIAYIHIHVTIHIIYTWMQYKPRLRASARMQTETVSELLYNSQDMTRHKHETQHTHTRRAHIHQTWFTQFTS